MMNSYTEKNQHEVIVVPVVIWLLLACGTFTFTETTSHLVMLFQSGTLLIGRPYIKVSSLSVSSYKAD